MVTKVDIKLKLTISEFAQRASGETRRRLLDGPAFTVENEEELPNAATP